MTLYSFEGQVPQIHPTAYVAPSAQVIGDVHLGAECYVGHGAILRGDYGRIEVGAATAIEEGVIVHARPGGQAIFEARVTIGHGAMVHNATIEEGATIGMRATVSDFAVVGAGAIVGEMALVKRNQEIPAHMIAVGVPARVVGEVSERNHDMAVWAKDVYVDLARRYPAGLKRIDEAPRDGTFAFRSIGVIHTPFSAAEGTPIQGTFAPDAQGTVEVDGAVAEGLSDLEGFSHVLLVYVLHESRGYDLLVTPFMDEAERGVFATRAPRRPNPLGLTVVRLLGVDGRSLQVAGVDMIDGTPLLDIKPHVPAFDAPPRATSGWAAPYLEARDRGEAVRDVADDRFHNTSE